MICRRWLLLFSFLPARISLSSIQSKNPAIPRRATVPALARRAAQKTAARPFNRAGGSLTN